jgi:hypothetical protein
MPLVKSITQPGRVGGATEKEGIRRREIKTRSTQGMQRK